MLSRFTARSRSFPTMPTSVGRPRRGLTILAAACSALLVAAVANGQSLPSPVINLPLNNGAGTTATDTSGNGNNGVLLNGPVWTNGKTNGGLSFDGIDDTLLINS